MPGFQVRREVAYDEWTLADAGFANAPATGQFLRNVADWFSGGQPGIFRAWANGSHFAEAQLAQTLTGAGHAWTVSVAGTFDLATLLAYDAVFRASTRPGSTPP